jgi:DUF4097 and DUF4098 domain-containing protein YvlB
MNLRIFASRSFIGLCMIAFAGCNVPRFSANRDYQKTIPVNSQVEVIADAFNGFIKVSPSDGPQIELVAHMKAYGYSVQDAEGALDSLIPEIDTTEDAVHIKTKKRDSMMNQDSVDFELKVPQKWPLRLHTSNGDVTVEDSSSPVYVKTSNGSVLVERAIGKIELTSSNGQVTLLGSDGEIAIKTSNGQIVMKDCSLQGDSQIKTSNGEVSLAMLNEYAVTVEADTSNGIISFDPNRLDAKKREDSHVTGLWHGSLPKDTKPSVKLTVRSSNGTISIQSTDTK